MRLRGGPGLAVAMGSAIVVLLLVLSGWQVRAIAFYSPWRTEQQLYKLDVGWPKHPEYFTGQPFCVAVDPLDDLIYVAQRGDNVPKILVFSEEGYFLHAWNSTLEMPHGIFVVNTPTSSSIWITDVGNGKYGHTVKQYSRSGKLIQVLGTPGKAGRDLNPLQFDQPAEIFVEQTGEIYVVDGDGGMNNRLLKLSPDFQEIWLRGGNGTEVGQFKIPHSVTVDTVGRVFNNSLLPKKLRPSLPVSPLIITLLNSQHVWVADRGNKRIQVFDKVTGEWLGAWNSCFVEDGPSSVRLTADEKYLIVAQLNINRVSVLAAPPVGSIGDCKVVNTIQLADMVKPHLVDINVKTGAIYVAEIGAQQVQKYVPLN